MSTIIGIDLGTTNSCVAVPANADIPDRDALIDARRLRPVGDAFVIANPDRSPTMPSAVWIGPDGTVLVGMRAKRKARASRFPPAMYFKRNMGTDQRVTAGHVELTPMEASAHVLRALKALAEEVLGTPVQRAVVTVPAFFETRAKQETTQAGAAAGLEIVETLIEPVAAAMAYTHDRQQTVASGAAFLIYDLGGGTFDTSVVSWDSEVGFENRSFDGDRYLGGYDFDRHLVNWMISHLPAYDLAINPEDPADMAVHAGLMALAEEAKHDLSRSTYTEIASMHTPDRREETMNINLEIERADFERMIDAQLRATMTSCTRALDRAGVAPAALSEVIMVGGSSRIPLVGQLLEEHLKKRPRLVNPDLCVAVGAALKAARSTIRSGVLELDRPDPTPPFTDISGRVRAEGEAADLRRVRVLLSSDDGTIRRTEVPAAEGTFLFADVELRVGQGNGFTVVVQCDGREIAAEHLMLKAGDAGPALTVSGDVLAHDFLVPLRTGLRLVVSAGTKLPHQAKLLLKTAGHGTALRVTLVEGKVPIGDVTIPDVPADLPIGSDVIAELEFELGWTIHARATIPSIGASATAVIDIPVREVPEWPELRRRHAEVSVAWIEKRNAISPTEALRIGPAIDDLIGEVELLLAEGHDRPKTHHKLLEVETTVDSVQVTEVSGLQPPLAEFEDLLAELRDLIGRLADSNPGAAERHRAAFPSLEAAGRAAYAASNQIDWLQANDALADRIRAVRIDLPTSGHSLDEIDPIELRVVLLGDLRGLAQDVQAKVAAGGAGVRPAGERLLSDIEQVAMEISAVNPGDPDAVRNLAVNYQNKVAPLHARAQNLVPENDHIALDER
jgi:actin-like ATPase involved in cell morphogenesis